MTPCRLKKGKYFVAPNCWKTFQEIVDGFTGLQILDQRAHWHARIRKYRRAAHDVGITFNKGGLHSLSSYVMAICALSRGASQGYAYRLDAV